MAKQTRSSRLNPVYLASRHAGVTFMLVALGVAAGMAWRALAQPVRYSARAETTAALQPASAAFDWEAKQREWRGLLADPASRATLSNNLRHALKLSATRDLTVDVGQLPGELLLLESGSGYTISLFQGLAARVGPSMTIRVRDLISNMDFQSLAAVVSDLDPPRDASEGWDFSFFRPAPGGIGVLVRPGRGDRYFRVFHHLYGLINPGMAAPTPEEAWRCAVDEVVARIERENRFAGGGGFGPMAKQELMREILAVSILAANGLYGAGGWEYGDDDFGYETALWAERWSKTGVSLRHTGGGEGRVDVETEMELYPLAFPRDTALTRSSPLAAATVLAYLAAREPVSRTTVRVRTEEPPRPAAAVVAPPPSPVAAPAPRRAAPPRIPTPIVREVVDSEAAARRREKIGALEESLRAARLEHASLLRRLQTARENVRRLSTEALAARERADRFKERYDQAAVREETGAATPPPETARLLAERDALAKRLVALLQYCTEEHPFVKEVRRDMAAIDLLLGDQNPGAESARDAEIRATRIANLYLEWETASASAAGMEERLRRQSDAADCLLRDLEELEKTVSRDETELALTRESPVPVVRVEEHAPEPEPEPEPEPLPEPEPVPVPAPAVTERTEIVAAPHLRLAPPPSRIPSHRQAPGWFAVWAGLALGLLLALAVGVLREVSGKRFHSAGEAKRLVGYPVLAVLRGYDAKSFRAAAKTMKGEIMRGKGGGMTFNPSPVEFAEPPPAARRGRLAVARRIPRVWAWLAGMAFLAAAAWLYHASGTGIAQPPWFRGELGLPAFSVEPGQEQSGETTP